MALLKVLDSRTVLKLFTVATMIALGIAVFGAADVSRWAFISIGFFISVMWSIIFSLALNSMADHHGSFSGILVTGIIGGAIMPVIVGGLGDWFGLRVGLLSMLLPLAYILSIGFWADPIITNERIRSHGD
jgi:fucose permease